MKFNLTAVAVMVACLSFAGCTSTSISRKSADRIHHVVVCWLKKPGDPAARQQLISATRGLQRLDGVESIRIGPPLASDRAVVDDSFDIAFVMTFRDAEALQRYEVDPRHVEVIERVIRPLTQRVLIYDFID